MNNKKRFNIALAGNPNSGKTTLFNEITGAKQHIGNYAGVTVEKKEGTIEHDDYIFNFVDLPGTYSLSAHSIEEIVARDYILSEKPDLVVDVVDSTNLERNLYLAVQLIQLEVPLILAFNMWDLATKRGFRIDCDKLSKLLGVPIVLTSGVSGEGVDKLLEVITNAVEGKVIINPANINYGIELEEEIAKLHDLIDQIPALTDRFPHKWFALKLLENDKEIYEMLENEPEIKATLENQVNSSRDRIRKIFGDEPEIIIADKRYGFISGACTKCVTNTVESRHNISDKIDEFLLHQIFGLPLFFFVMWAIFQSTFTFGQYPTSLLEFLFAKLGSSMTYLIPEGLLRSLVVDGIISGVGGVLVFLPNILILFFAISILEDSGYMARASFLMDKIMNKIGLQGKSFIPLLLGFGCSVPAIMATRTLENKQERLITIMAIPFMSCVAKLPVYILLISAFFSPQQKGNILFLIYMIGVLTAICTSVLLNKFVLKDTSQPFIMELPPYRVPTLKGAFIHTWERGKMYLKKVSTIIFAFSVIIWVLSTFPLNVKYSQDYESMIKSVNNQSEIQIIKNKMSAEKLEKSYAGKIGHIIVPVLKPIGLDNWRIGVALFTGFAAKEIVVSTLSTLYSVGEPHEHSQNLQNALKKDTSFSPLSAFVLMVFTLLYIPCMGTVAAIKYETGSLKWTLGIVFYCLFVAWITSFLIYNLGRLFI